jgi:surfeit locus 1 family protein
LIAAVVCVVITASLGVWQLRRAAYKEQRAQQIQNRDQLPALDGAALSRIDGAANKGPDSQGADSSWLQRRAILEGRWLHAHTIFLDNRPMHISGSQRVGFYVVTPLQLEGRAELIWVQRGWVQRDFQDRTKLPALPQTSDRVRVEGRLMAEASRAYEMSSSQTATDSATTQTRPSRIWQNMPVVPMPGKTLLPMVLLQTVPDTDNDGLQRGWPAPDTGVAKHYGYAFQWFALSALFVILYVWFQLIAPRRRAQVS